MELRIELTPEAGSIHIENMNHQEFDVANLPLML